MFGVKITTEKSYLHNGISLKMSIHLKITRMEAKKRFGGNAKMVMNGLRKLNHAQHREMDASNVDITSDPLFSYLVFYGD